AGDARAVSTIREVFARQEPVYVSTITQAELLSFRRLTREDEQVIEGMMATVSLIPVDSQVARLAAAIRRTHGLPLPDSLIAATALFTGSTLLTRNTRDFRKVASLALHEV
ncbi:MAG: type II toxin-antitoxin system VapC family toxin, partial [Limisphaerales bacterium]